MLFTEMEIVDIITIVINKLKEVEENDQMYCCIEKTRQQNNKRSTRPHWCISIVVYFYIS